jgi:single-strand DNA-binding protein
MNSVTLFGSVDNDPELSGIPGRDVCEIWLAVQGPRDKRPLHIKVITFRGLAEDCAQHLNRGDQVAVTGSLRSDKFNPRNGRMREYIHSVIAREVQFAGVEGEPVPAKEPSASSDQPRYGL